MYKPNNKKMLTVLISIAMVFSAFAILSFAAEPAFATASGTVTYNPTTFGISSGDAVETTVFASGGSFSSGATVYFYLSTTDSGTGISGNEIGSTILTSASPTTLDQKVTLFTSAEAVSAGTYYILASESSASPANFAFPVASSTFVSYNPTVSFVHTNVKVGSNQEVTGSSFDPAASVTLFLSYPGSSTVLGTTTTTSSGAFDTHVTIPALAQGTYTVVAQETNSLSSNFVEGGITADTQFTIVSAITVSPASISGASGTTLTITGSGFTAGATIAASSSSVTSDSIAVGTSSSPGSDVLTYHSLVTVASDGSFTVTATLSGNVWTSSTQGAGGLYVVVTTSTATTAFEDAVYSSIPNPVHLALSYSITQSAATQNSPNDPLAVSVWNYPASTSVSVYLGYVLVGKITTDSNGYGSLSSSAIVPAVPAGSYNIYANTSAGLDATVAVSSGISGYFTVTDPIGTVLDNYNNEYFPSNGTYTVTAYGLNPTDTYTWTDGLASSTYATQTVAVGTMNSDGTFSPASNGTLIFMESPAYDNTTVATGTSSGSLTLVGTSSGAVTLGYLSTGATEFLYLAVGPITISHPSYLADQGAGSTGLSLTITSGVIPASSTVYPGISYEYNAYIGTSELTITIGSTSSVVFEATSGQAVSGATFANPTLTSGIYNFSLVYAGSAVSTALVAQPVIISTSGSSVSSGSIALYADASSSYYEIVGYGFDSAATVTPYYMTSAGLMTGSASVSSYGAFVYDTSGATIPLADPISDLPGTYSVFAVATLGSASNTVYTSYTVTSSLTLGGTSGTVGATISGSTATGLSAGAYYDLYFGSTYLKTLGPASSTGSLSSFSFTVPVVPAGTYKITLDPTGTTTVAATGDHSFKVKANSAITLGTSSQYAFPGQLVTFSVTGFSLASPLNIALPGPTEYFAQISFNGTLVATVPASFSSGTLSGSFINPNNAPGSYYEITFGGYLQASSLTSSGGSITTGTIAQVALTNSGSTSDFFGLVSGNGALLTGITSSEIATIEADINSTVSTSLTVPISQLNAAITSINGAVATLKTTVGNITTDLSTINATVASISSGQALVLTDLGSISTSLASLNASLVAFNNNVVTINTTLGQVVTSLGSIQTQVKANANGIATVTTAVGTVQGQIVSQNGNITTVKTSLGTLTANVSKVQSQTSGFPTLEIFLIVIIVLVLITLVISFLAVNAANKAARRATEEKKQ